MKKEEQAFSLPIMQEQAESESDECCSGDDCCTPVKTPGGLNRRIFMKLAGVGAAALTTPRVIAGPFEAPKDEVQHFVPADKKLNPEWINLLLDKGESKIYKGKELETIGMPIGGIATGQLYLGGDGRLLHWDIFNEHIFTGYGLDCYDSDPPESPVDQGFAIRVEQEGKVQTRRLDHTDYPGVEFLGEYPIGKVFYKDDQFPVSVELKAFSPFIPLNAADSALPATVMQFTVKNNTEQSLSASLAGWLENSVCLNSGHEMFGERLNQLIQTRNLHFLNCSARSKPRPETERPPEVFANFEGNDYGDWKVDGEAFGSGPAKGTLPGQQNVSGYKGEGLVNSFLGGDEPHGKLISPTFEIKRPYINFLVGGGKRGGELGIQLIVDGEVVRNSMGNNRERLEWAFWNVSEWIGKTAHIEIVDNAHFGWGHINVDHIEFADQPHPSREGVLEDQEDYGTMGLALLEGRRGVLASTSLPDGDMPDALFSDNGLLYQTQNKNLNDAAVRDFGLKHRGALGKTISLRPGEEETITFAITWYFPDKRIPGREDDENLRGRYYSNRFASAYEVADFIEDQFDRLAGDTERWHQTYYDSTLPHWLLDRIHYTVANLATSTAQWFNNGRFWGWEGVGCCHGTCTHVWNYAHALARLFPELERSAREMQDLGIALEESGRIRFRGEFNNHYAADGQAGTILKCYREHLTSKDDDFLKRNWPKIKLALSYLLEQDNNDDGLIENSQHNTFDINFFGANTFVGSLYLAALRAAEEMALKMGEKEFAGRCRSIFNQGSRLSVNKLFNGEYFIQDVDLEEHPEHQYGEGCLSDQLFGQGWAHQLGLGYIYPQDKVVSALNSIYKYNWAPDVGPQNKVHLPERYFARAGEAGLFTCTWPLSKHLDKGVRYKNEVWTGIEYQAAGHMLYEGLLIESLAIIRGIHERYDGLKHNPYNEVECGDHYARALASWGCLIGLAGFEFNGPEGHIGFSPKMTPAQFRVPFTGAEGWGTLEQKQFKSQQVNTIEVHWGQLNVKTLHFQIQSNTDVTKVELELDGKPVDIKQKRIDYETGDIRLILPEPVMINAGEMLKTTIHTAKDHTIG